jgi:sugar phosphate isomerase/epimerase
MLGIGSYAFRWQVGIGDRIPARPITAQEILARADALGVRLVQFTDNLPLHRLPPDEIAALGSTAERLGIRLELGMTGCDPALVATYLKLAGELGVRLVRIAPTAAESAGTDAALAERFRAILPACRAAGVTLAVENHFHLPSPRLVRLIEAVADPQVGVCLDVCNSLACQEWPAETVRLLAPHAVNLHLKDYRIALDPHGVGGAFVGTPLGQGLLDVGSVFEALAAAGRHVNTILEHWLPWQGDFEATQALEQAWLEQSVAAGKARVGEPDTISA